MMCNFFILSRGKFFVEISVRSFLVLFALQRAILELFFFTS